MKSRTKTIPLGPALVGFLVLTVLAIPIVRHPPTPASAIRADIGLVRR
ncbi:hypothetical protein [Rhizobium sp. RU20A]|nr:hypothetical protein [Rhizobium sp. RU20A]